MEGKKYRRMVFNDVKAQTRAHRENASDRNGRDTSSLVLSSRDGLVHPSELEIPCLSRGPARVVCKPGRQHRFSTGELNL